MSHRDSVFTSVTHMPFDEVVHDFPPNWQLRRLRKTARLMNSLLARSWRWPSILESLPAQTDWFLENSWKHLKMPRAYAASTPLQWSGLPREGEDAAACAMKADYIGLALLILLVGLTMIRRQDSYPILGAVVY